MQITRRVWKRYRLRRIVGSVSKWCFCRYVLTWWLVCWMLFGIPVQIAMANPNPGSDVVPGTGNVIGTPLDWTGSSGLDAVINTATGNNTITWNNFDIGSNASVTFTQNGGWILNNVQALDAMATGINGGLNADLCGLIVVNPLGVVFGPDALVSARSFVASTLDVSTFNDDTLAFIKGDGIGKIDVMDGAQIQADALVALIGQKVLNAGTISCPDGLVLMAAGDRVYLNTAGSDVVVEVSSVTIPDTPPFDGMGDVSNEETGTIDADSGQIVLAAGDVFSTALGIRASAGVGRVVQNGEIHADGTTGDGGSVILTASDEVLLGSGGSITANALPDGTGDDRPVGGEVVISSPEKVTASPDAHIEARGNGYYDMRDNGRFDIGEDIDFRGSIQVIGSYITPPTDVDLSPWSGDSEQAGYLTIGNYEGDLIVADGGLTGEPAKNTVYEEWIEEQSDLGVNVDLLAFDNIIAQTLSSSTDPGLEGGSGDMAFRTMFDSGGITFDTADLISTDNGGNIFMLAGSGGITVGDIMTDVPPSDKITDPGQIFLLTARPETAEDGGDITTGSMVVDGGSKVEISAIAAGTLTVNGDVISKTNQVPGEDQTVGKALICLIADEDVIVNADVIEVEAHGKFETNANICISAGWDVDIANPAASDASAVISAEAKTSESGPHTADASIVLHAGWNKEGKGTISINGDTYNDGLGADNSHLPVSATASVSGIGGGGPVAVDTSDPWSEDDPLDPPDGFDDGTHKAWQDERTKDYEGQTARATVTIVFDNDEEISPGDERSPCYDCPRPPFLPPIPPVLIIVDDDETISWSDVESFLDVLSNDDDGGPLFVSTHTDTGGTLDPIYDDDPMSPTYGRIIGFEYTPPPDAVFMWDGVSDYAEYIDTFTYRAQDGEGNISINTATVTISVTNFLPTVNGDSETIHMDETATFTLAEGGLIIDPDGSPGDLELDLSDPVFGDSSLSGPTAPADATYTPFEGFIGTDDFDYTVTDSTINYQGNPVASATLEVTVENELPSGGVTLENAHMDAVGQELSVVSGDFTDADDDFVIASITAATDDDNKTFGGTLVYNGDNNPYNDDVDGTYDYSADSALPGYVGEDDFDVQLWDGQYDYQLSETPLEGYELFIDNAEGADIYRAKVYGSGTIDLTVTNTRPSGAVVLEDAHMDASGETLSVVSGDFTDADDDFAITSITAATGDDNKTFGGSLSYNGSDDPYVSGDTYDYTADGALPGYVGEDDFDVQLWDGENSYVFTLVNEEWVATPTPEYGSGTIDLGVTNTLPTASGDLGQTFADTVLVVTQTGTTSPVLVVDPEPDILSIPPAISPLDHYTGSAGGTLEFDGTNWTYTPAPGYTGPEQFTINVSDGQNNYVFTFVDEQWTATPTPEHGTGTVSVTVGEAPPPPLMPAAPLPELPIPELEGCPVLLEAVAAELGIGQEGLQISMGTGLALNPNIQPCNACERLLNAATMLADANSANVAALAMVIDEFVPPGMPPSEEQMLSIAAALADHVDDGTHYAAAGEWVNTLNAYIELLTDELGWSTPRAVEQMQKYIGPVSPISEGDYASAAAYAAVLLEGLGGD